MGCSTVDRSVKWCRILLAVFEKLHGACSSVPGFPRAFTKCDALQKQSREWHIVPKCSGGKAPELGFIQHFRYMAEWLSVLFQNTLQQKQSVILSSWHWFRMNGIQSSRGSQTIHKKKICSLALVQTETLRQWMLAAAPRGRCHQAC